MSDKTTHFPTFLVYCSGANKEYLLRCPGTEHIKYACIGALIFLGSLFAALSGGYALYMVFQDIKFSILFGMLWALLIFWLNRYVVSSIRKDTKGSFRGRLREWGQGIPRFVLAIIIGIGIAYPLELKIFDKEIKAQLQENINKEVTNTTQNLREKIKTGRQQTIDGYERRIRELQAVKEASQEKIQKYEEQLKETYNIISDESTGKVRTGSGGNKITSGLKGYGPLAQQREQQIGGIKASLTQEQSVITNIDKNIHDCQEQIKTISLDIDDKLKEEMKNLGTRSIDETGLLDRTKALKELSNNNESVFWTILYIGLLFIVMEILPTLVKLVAPAGPYDIYVEEEITTYKNRYGFESDIDTNIHRQEAEFKKERYNEELEVRRHAEKNFDNIKRSTIQELTQINQQFFGDLVKEIKNKLQQVIDKWCDTVITTGKYDDDLTGVMDAIFKTHITNLHGVHGGQLNPDKPPIKRPPIRIPAMAGYIQSSLLCGFAIGITVILVIINEYNPLTAVGIVAGYVSALATFFEALEKLKEKLFNILILKSQ